MRGAISQALLSTTWKRRPLTSSRFDPHETVLRRRVPREQRQVKGVEQVLHPLDLLGLTFDHDAPCGSGFGVVAVNLEGHGAAQYRGRQLGSLRRAEHHRPVIDDEVDREDVRVIGDRNCEMADVAVAEQIPAHVGLEDRHSEAVGLHVPSIRPVAVSGPGANVPTLPGPLCGGDDQSGWRITTTGHEA